MKIDTWVTPTLPRAPPPFRRLAMRGPPMALPLGSAGTGNKFNKWCLLPAELPLLNPARPNLYYYYCFQRCCSPTFFHCTWVQLGLECRNMEETLGPSPSQDFGLSPALAQACCLIPALILILQAPFYISKIFSHHRCVQLSYLFLFKLALVGALAIVQIRIVLQWWHVVPIAPRLARLQASASYTSMPSLAFIAILDHLYSEYQTPFLSAFLCLTSLVDMTAFPTYFYPTELRSATTTAHWPLIILKVSLLVLEQFPKPGLTNLGGSVNGTIQKSFEQMPLWKWTRLYLLFGFQSKIEKEHTTGIDEELRAETLHKDFMEQWAKGI